MKTLWIALASILALVTSAYAHMETSSVEDMMNSMMTEQNASELGQLDCSKIPDSEFEELGDAVMDRMMNNQQLHEQMDNMMGGEGSASLTQMHIVMGENWLGCGTGFQGMMGTSMMPMMMRMMGSYYPAYYSSYNTILILAIVGWSLLILLIAIRIILISTRKTQKRR